MGVLRPLLSDSIFYREDLGHILVDLSRVAGEMHTRVFVLRCQGVRLSVQVYSAVSKHYDVFFCVGIVCTSSLIDQPELI